MREVWVGWTEAGNDVPSARVVELHDERGLLKEHSRQVYPVENGVNRVPDSRTEMHDLRPLLNICESMQHDRSAFPLSECSGIYHIL